MYPNHNTYGGSRRNPARFQATFMNGNRQSQGHVPTYRSNSTSQPTQPNEGGRTAIVRPGVPHYFGTRVDQQTFRVINNLCRCQDPMSHGSAWTIEGREVPDINGRIIDYQQFMNRVLDHFGTATVTYEQQTTAWRLFLDPRVAASFEMNDRRLEAGARAGRPIFITNDATYHNADGHAQALVDTQGMRTIRNDERHAFRNLREGYGRDFRSYGYGGHR
ncbi:hypothetical protein HBI31_226280 [Parastagonospora nodorum]|nr:hypothetical protein HBI31_226280 [Parastagonospora nodorum]KAH5674252.1 hypothetical protein HBI21_141970 [Parastagonospora nodorum]